METDRYVRTTRSAEDYQELSDVMHVYKIPDAYIGSTEPEEREEVLLNLETLKLVKAQINLSRGVERLFLEILSNAGDNADTSRRAGINPGGIHVTMDRNWIRVRNGGLSIPVVAAKNSPNKLVPDLIFGQLRSSSNYDPKVIRMGCGRNGFGAKLTNIFSKVFTVNVGDNVNKLHYKGTWQNNMSDGPHKEVTKYTDAEGFVEVSWLLDFERFGMKEYPDEAFALFARYVADFSLTCKVPVSFNGVDLDLRNIRNYAMLHFTPEECETAILHYEWNKQSKEHPNGISPFTTNISNINKERIVSAAVKAEHIPIVELMILDTPDAGVCYSFVNGLMSIDGGVHVNAALNALSHDILHTINSSIEKRSKADKDTKTMKLTMDDIKRHVSIILNCRLPDPKYSSQSKTQVTSPKPNILIPNHLIKDVEKWELIKRLYAALDAKLYNILKKTNGGRVKHVYLDNGSDANDAGTEKSSECVLYLVEGKSASAYPKKRISFTEGGKDLNGYYPLRGKFMNVRNAPIPKIAANKEIIAIKSLIGLREGLDYSLPENILTLRYGYIMICVDADSDGFHIASLIINYINHFFPGLLYMGRVAILRTPVVRIFDSSDRILHRFYSTTEFEKWEAEEKKREHPFKGMKIVYYKGLGKSKDKDIQDDMKTAPVVTVVYDEQAHNSLVLAFDKGLTESRKEWISKWREITHIDDVTFVGTGVFRKQSITNFINHELINYTKDALFRAIPSQDDGLKRSHRQALYAALKYFRYGRNKKDEPNVARFAAYAASETNYHHGEMSMCETLIKMAQTFVGSNNLPFLQGEGQFGTRDELGADAASPRYIHLKLPEYAPILYDEELIDCIPKRRVEESEVEPLYVPAAIPMHLVNGMIGIATGYSTYIPNHNYYDIITWCKNRCVNGNLNVGVVMKPWFRGFTGQVLFENITEEQVAEEAANNIERSEIQQESGEDDAQTHETAAKRAKGVGVKTVGIFKVDSNKKKGDKMDFIVTELPIGLSIDSYRRYLELLLKEKTISDFRDNSTPDKPYFTVTGYVTKSNSVSYKTLRLEKSFTLNNMTLIDENGYPTKYSNTNEVMEVYAQRMISLYQIVKDNRLTCIEAEILDLSERIRFITAVLEGRIVIFKRSKKDILADMLKQSPPIPEKYLTSVKLHECTAEEVKQAHDEILKLRKEHEETLRLKPEDIWLARLTKLESYLRKNGW